ncbi:unnamed protein product [Symbiodinium natans]|uniref:Uncharacterized protein n=1 Tax=Symbiodinium natans TaxID=878477 RepID=A0A812T5B3_9DINO|nr:unnamed protein product [Symbiodinium natans]
MAASHSWSSRPNALALHGRPPIPQQPLPTTFYLPGQRAAYPVQRPHVHIGPAVPGDALSTQVGAEVESKFGFIFRKLGLMVQANKTMLRINGRWNFAPEYEVFFEQRRVIAAALREYPEAPEDLLRQHAENIDNALGAGQFTDSLLVVARGARSMSQDAARAVQTCWPPVPSGSVLLEIDFVIGPTQQVDEDAADLNIPVPVMTLTGQQIPEGQKWSTIASNCQNGAFVEVTSQSWEKHGKLRSHSLQWLHEARQQFFPQGHTMYFYDGSMQHFGAVGGLHCYWFQKSCLLQVKELLLEEQLRKVNAEKSALMAHSSAGTTSTSSVVWVRQLIRQDQTVTEKLRPKEDGKEFESVNAFQVKGALANVDDLKEAIEKKEKLTIAASNIDVYSLKDKAWVKEEKMSASLRDTTEADCYGFVLPPADNV